MPSVAELLERESTSVDLEGDHFERLLRRRDRMQRNQRIRSGALAVIVALVTVAALARAFNGVDRTADEPRPRTFTGDVIRYSNANPRGSGDLVAVDPNTGGVRTLVDARSFGSDFRDRLIGWAAPSADGRWVAFQLEACGGSRSRKGMMGLWVTDGREEPRQLTKPCLEDPDVQPYGGLWEWSPAGAQLALVRESVGRDSLILIDPATGARTHLGKVAGDVTSLAWSPDGTRIAYGTVPAETEDDDPPGSVYSVGVGGGDHALLAGLVGTVSGGETGAGILWSPDGTRIAVTTEARENRLYVMNADGSDLDLVAEDVVIAHILGSPNAAWSPDGTKIAYATSGDDDWAGDPKIWNASRDASATLEISGSFAAGDPAVSGPVWSPDGTWIAFRYGPDGDKRYLVAKADGTGHADAIGSLPYLSWRGGWYFCECYG